MALDKSFSWLGRFPLAVDVADTVRVVGPDAIDLLAGGADLDTWIAAERERFPFVAAAHGRLHEFRRLRDSVRDLLYARAAAGPLPEPAIVVINAAAASSPGHPVLSRTGAAQTAHVAGTPFDVLAARVATSAIDVVTGADGDSLAICHARGCGMLFVRAHGKQRWCSVRCGTRERVARHAARRRSAPLA